MTTTPKNYRIQRRPEVLQQLGWCKSTLQNRMNDGLYPPPVSLGGRSVGWLSHETDEIVRALAAGCSADEIRSLVREQIANRQNLKPDKTDRNRV